MNVLKIVAALAAIAAGGVHAAHAVEVRKVAEVKAAPAVVWAKVGEWCAIKSWHPAIADCKPGKKGVRTLTLKDGGQILEKITKTGPNTYSYDIIDSPLPVKNYSATLTAKVDSLGTTDLVWTAKFDPAKGKTAAEAEAVIAGIFDAGLNNIKTNIKFDAPAVGVAPAAAPATAAAPAAAAAKVAPLTAAAKAAARDEARLKAREERRKRYEAAKLAAMEKYARAKAVFAEKAKAAADAAKAAYEKAKAALTAPAAPATPATSVPKKT